MKTFNILFSLIFILFLSCDNNSNKSVVDAKIQFQKKVLKNKLNEKQANKSNSSSNNYSNSSSSNKQNNCLKSATVYFTGPHTCEIKQNLTVRRSGFDISSSTAGFGEPYASMYPYGNECVKGNYSFSWSYYSQCVNFGDPDGPYSYSGTFYLDGKHETYYVNLDYSGYPSVSGY